ncbi:MAG TPA: hypothetical protein VHE13_01520 [Opitutus sp.]|nr:hypothetical protein [Opitutus sp.]
MTLPLLKTLQAGPPAPKVVLLPDALFFTRAVPVAAGASAADVAAQVELALETLSPFPPAQLYHGYYWPAGATSALVFAAYRRRFTTEQLAEWDDAELVLPAFAALLGGESPAGGAVVVPSSGGLSAIYWGDGPVPARVAFRPLDPEADDAAQAAARDALLETVPSTQRTVLATPPAAVAGSDGEFVFQADAFESRLPAALATPLDVRDKEALAALRNARRRDLALWRGLIAGLAALVVLGLGELAVVGLGFWRKSILTQVTAQRPVVEKVMTAQALTTRINELSTKRLLPIEMMTPLVAKKPGEVRFLRTTTDGLYALTVEAESTSPAAVSAYQSALGQDPAIDKVEIRDQRTRDNIMNFRLEVAFKPDQLKPAAAAAPAKS